MDSSFQLSDNDAMLEGAENSVALISHNALGLVISRSEQVVSPHVEDISHSNSSSTLAEDVQRSPVINDDDASVSSSSSSADWSTESEDMDDRGSSTDSLPTLASASEVHDEEFFDASSEPDEFESSEWEESDEIEVEEVVWGNVSDAPRPIPEPFRNIMSQFYRGGIPNFIMRDVSTCLNVFFMTY